MKRIVLVVMVVMVAVMARPCTNFLVTKGASTDGSTFVSYAADSYWLFGALCHYPAADHQPGDVREVYDWDSGKFLGTIPEVAHTYEVIGNMNEYQLCIGETTYGGREELVDTTAIVDYGSLIYITLQRAKTAREAIDVMTSLVATYGYASEGESFSIADANEVWILEMIGKGMDLKRDRKGNVCNKNRGAVWVAKRIPDGYVSAHANQARITTIDFDDKENCLYAKDVIAFARKAGYYTGSDEEFSFSDVYNPLDFGGLRFCEARVWSFFCKVNSSMGKYYSYINGESKGRMPLYVLPDKKLDCQFVMECMRDHYEGTPLDMTKGVGAGNEQSPFRKSPLTWKVDSVEYYHERPVATQQTGFSFVAQMRSWLPNAVGGIFWFGVDDATFNNYVPMFCGIKRIPTCFDENNGSLLDFSWTSAFWVYNWVANMAYSRYSDYLPYVQREQNEQMKRFLTDLPGLEQKVQSMEDDKEVAELLTRYSCEQAEAAMAEHKQLGEFLMVKYLDGVMKKDENGKFLQNDKHIPAAVVRPGYTEDYNRRVVNEDKERFRYKSVEELSK